MFTQIACCRYCTLARSERASKCRPTSTRSVTANGAESVWAGLTFKSCGLSTLGQGVSILAHGPVPCFKRSGWCISIFGRLHQMDQIAQRVVRFERVSQPQFKVCGWVPCFKCTGQWVSILVLGRYPRFKRSAGAYLYLDVRIKWTKIVIVAHISDWDKFDFHLDRFLDRGSWMWSRKMLIVPAALTIIVIVIVAPKVDPGTFSDWVSSTFT